MPRPCSALEWQASHPRRQLRSGFRFQSALPRLDDLNGRGLRQYLPRRHDQYFQLLRARPEVGHRHQRSAPGGHREPGLRQGRQFQPGRDHEERPAWLVRRDHPRLRQQRAYAADVSDPAGSSAGVQPAAGRQCRWPVLGGGRRARDPGRIGIEGPGRQHRFVCLELRQRHQRIGRGPRAPRTRPQAPSR